MEVVLAIVLSRDKVDNVSDIGTVLGRFLWLFAIGMYRHELSLTGENLR